MGLFSKNCATNYSGGFGPFKKGCYTRPSAPAPNPDPSRWRLLQVDQYEHAHVLTVHYLDATNFEGVKVMVFRGQYVPRDHLDPHFTPEATSPIARFRPDAEGRALARAVAQGLT